MYSCGPPHMDVQEWDDQHEPTYSSCVRTRDETLKTCRRRWMIGRNGERRSGISAQAARHDDDDDDDIVAIPNPEVDYYLYYCHRCDLVLFGERGYFSNAQKIKRKTLKIPAVITWDYIIAWNITVFKEMTVIDKIFKRQITVIVAVEL